MTSQPLTLDESWISKLVVAIGSRLLPAELTGGITLTLPSGKDHRIGFTTPGITCDLQLRSWWPVWSSIRRASVGFSEAYLEGQWESSDITALIRFYLQNRSHLDSAAAPVFSNSVFDRIAHVLRPNNRNGARRNISAHYDLGNDFYALWLDETMSYSAAYFGHGASTLAAGQLDKYGLVLDALGVTSGGRVLEIGCGWGGFAEAAIGRGLNVTGLTISQQQLDYAKQRLGDRADLRFEDYRDCRGSFDGIASIEMIEAVGERNWPVYFGVLRDRLKPGASAVVQAITIDEPLFPAYRSGADFIQRYIFPGGMLPTRTILAEQAGQAGLEFQPLVTFGHDYARTLAMWRDRFETAWPQIAALGFDDSFRRRWRYYLAYCEAGFAENSIDVGLYRFRRPR